MAAIEFNNQKMDAIIREARACGASDIHISEGMQTQISRAWQTGAGTDTVQCRRNRRTSAIHDERKTEKTFPQTETMPTLQSAHRTDAASVSMYFASRKK